MIAGAYTLDLYCDGQNAAEHRFREFPHQFIGQTEGECFTQARKRGWSIGNRGSAKPESGGRAVYCPACRRAGLHKKKTQKIAQ